MNGTRRLLPTAPLSAAVLCAVSAVTPAHAGVNPVVGAAALRAELRSLMPQRGNAPATVAATHTVASCADDDGAQTLRAAIAAAGEGDTIDLTQLSCSQITLTQGALPVLLDNLSVTGPGSRNLRIDGAGADRVFVHPGSGTLAIAGVTVENGSVSVSGNHVTGGGCIASSGYVTLDHAVVSGCTAIAEGVYGGGIFAYALRMYTSTLAGNAGIGAQPTTGTATFGGGAYASTISLHGSTVSGNRAIRDAAQTQSGYEIGGGIFTNNGGYVGASTIEGNYSRGIGGGIAVFSGTIGVVNSTLSGNVAKTASGGALDVRTLYGGTISNSTITANHAVAGGGVYLRGRQPAFALQSSLVAGNVADQVAPDLGALAATNIAGANNLVVGVNANVTLPGDTLHADPLLFPLADNGGPTRTHALRPASPALDAGNNSVGLSTDQRGAGFPRQLGAAPDIGAFEGFVAPAPGPVNVPLSPGGLGLLAGLLAALGAACGSGSPRFRRLFTRLSPGRGHSSHR